MVLHWNKSLNISRQRMRDLNPYPKIIHISRSRITFKKSISWIQISNIISILNELFNNFIYGMLKVTDDAYVILDRNCFIHANIIYQKKARLQKYTISNCISNSTIISLSHLLKKEIVELLNIRYNKRVMRDFARCSHISTDILNIIFEYLI